MDSLPGARCMSYYHLEPQFSYFKYEHLKPAFRLCVRGQVQGQDPCSGHQRKGHGSFVVEPGRPGE